MRASDRSSARAADDLANYLAKAHDGGPSGAEGRELLASTNARTGRVGPSRLQATKQQLSDRQLSVLHLVDQLKFVGAGQAERAIYRPGLTSLSAARTARRDLQRLHDLHLLERLERRVGGERAGSASYVYALSDQGGRLIGHRSRRRTREPSLGRLEHVLAVSELVVQLTELARRQGFQLSEVQTEPACWRPLLGAHGSRATLKPDLRLTIGVGEIELHWFVEVDRGSEHRPVLQRKLSAYLAYWQGGREQASCGVFPKVLWLVPSLRRAELLTAAFAASEAPEGMFVVTTAGSVVEMLTTPEAQL